MIITTCDKIYYKMWQVLLSKTKFIAKFDTYCKIWQVLQVWQLLEGET